MGDVIQSELVGDTLKASECGNVVTVFGDVADNLFADEEKIKGVIGGDGCMKTW